MEQAPGLPNSVAREKVHLVMLAAPSTLIGLLLLTGVVLAIAPKTRRPAFMLMISGAAFYLVLGSGWVATLLMNRLESRHPAATEDQFETGRAIVILTGYAKAEPGVSSVGQLNRASAFRVLEASRLVSQRPMPVYISGSGEVPAILERALRSVTDPTVAIQVDSQSASTYESGVNLKPRLENQPFFLITSAGHMPRSIAVFESQGMHPLPVPTDFLAQRDIHHVYWLPAGRYLAISDLAIHEYLGMLWYKLTGRL